MLFNILYYNLSKENKLTNSNISVTFASFRITSEEVTFFFSRLKLASKIFCLDYHWNSRWTILINSQSFDRAILSTNFHSSNRTVRVDLQIILSPLKTLLSRPQFAKKNCSLRFPWWCIYFAYALSFLIIGVSILFIIARGIEFGDEKSQKWLISIITGFFSSIFLTQPLKVIDEDCCCSLN